ncbi:RNA 3'-terminal phosphate cyclase-like protein [Centruroides sculpturatus]|uniref:RNA 3'-terminal phosphate cyclase-like protein n=1 Tax=Centruroides sculpturatus TaxID=218467 RepID=UPI000C6D30F3|nr:RNA 3'-terminal phosphate cyclase-like protein [Centruroides sculpturatus]
MAAFKNTCLVYEGSNFFRQRLILSTLSMRPVKIKNIRFKDEEPGVRDFEVCFTELLDKITNGTLVNINETGTVVYYQPGLLYGGKIEHDCGTGRSIGYYLEALVSLAPFCKKPLNVTLYGVTNDDCDPSVDAIKYSSLPVLKKFLINNEGIEIKIIGRGMAPNGGGQVKFTCPICKQLMPVQLTNPGKVRRIRGVAYATRVSPQMANRMVDAAKGILLKFLSDVYVYTDHCKGKHSGKSPGFGICLVAETTEGAFLCAEAISNPSGSDKGPSVPEDIGKKAACLLLEEIYRGGCIDSSNQSLAALFMALGQVDVSKVITGPLSPYMIQFLRHTRDFLQVIFKMEVQHQENENIGTEKVLLTCVGIGFTNLSKAQT